MSALVNEKALPYDGEDFEVALLHGLMAWDFLRQGDLNGTMVEVARGGLVDVRVVLPPLEQVAGCNLRVRTAHVHEPRRRAEVALGPAQHVLIETC